MSQGIHIVSFDAPYPPDYGGVIDVYYKIRYLHAAGIPVHLHYFSYPGDRRSDAACRAALEPYCASIRSYRRTTGWRSAFSLKPYIVYSRRSEELVRDLCRDQLPVLFEGLHTCYCLDDARLSGRTLLYRESNIEHHYYRHLARAERSLWKQAFFLTESVKLRTFQKILKHASAILTVSQSDSEYLSGCFPDLPVTCIPSFHRDNEVNSLPGTGEYVLYQGNLSVPENIAAVSWLIEQVWDPLMPELVVAGKKPADRILELTAGHPNVRLVPDPDEDAMTGLLRNAHINLLVTFQPTGLKLKLLNALYNGRFCLVNPQMLAGTALNSLCLVATTPREFRDRIRTLKDRSFTQDDIEAREKILRDQYSNEVSGRLLTGVIGS